MSPNVLANLQYCTFNTTINHEPFVGFSTWCVIPWLFAASYLSQISFEKDNFNPKGIDVVK